MGITHFEILVTILASLTAVTASLALGVRWIYRQGAAGQKLVNSIDRLTVRMDDNTIATNRLATAQANQTEKTADHLLQHEKRITRLEAHEDRLLSKDLV